jgi:hypothetical protein
VGRHHRRAKARRPHRDAADQQRSVGQHRHATDRKRPARPDRRQVRDAAAGRTNPTSSTGRPDSRRTAVGLRTSSRTTSRTCWPR